MKRAVQHMNYAQPDVDMKCKKGSGGKATDRSQNTVECSDGFVGHRKVNGSILIWEGRRVEQGPLSGRLGFG